MIASVPKKITDTSPASASTAASASIAKDMGAFETIQVFARLTGATGGTLDVYLVDSFNGGTTWRELAHFTQVAAAGAARTYSVSPVLDSTMTTVGEASTPAGCVGTLAAGSVRPGLWGDWISVVYVAGASTSAGATQTITIHGHNSRR